MCALFLFLLFVLLWERSDQEFTVVKALFMWLADFCKISRSLDI